MKEIHENMKCDIPGAIAQSSAEEIELNEPDNMEESPQVSYDCQFTVC